MANNRYIRSAHFTCYYYATKMGFSKCIKAMYDPERTFPGDSGFNGIFRAVMQKCEKYIIGGEIQMKNMRRILSLVSYLILVLTHSTTKLNLHYSAGGVIHHCPSRFYLSMRGA